MGYKTFSSFDEYLSDQSVQNKDVIQSLRTLIGKIEPRLIESSKWGQGCWLNPALDDLPVLFVSTDTNRVRLGFYAGSLLDDTSALLYGDAKFVRYLNIGDSVSADDRALVRLIQQAAQLNYK